MTHGTCPIHALEHMEHAPFTHFFKNLGMEHAPLMPAAYREVVCRHHPDKGGDRHRFEVVQKAYAVRFFSVAELDTEYTKQYEMRRKACI